MFALSCRFNENSNVGRDVTNKKCHGLTFCSINFFDILFQIMHELIQLAFTSANNFNLRF